MGCGPSKSEASQVSDPMPSILQGEKKHAEANVDFPAIVTSTWATDSAAAPGTGKKDEEVRDDEMGKNKLEGEEAVGLPPKPAQNSCIIEPEGGSDLISDCSINSECPEALKKKEAAEARKAAGEGIKKADEGTVKAGETVDKAYAAAPEPGKAIDAMMPTEETGEPMKKADEALHEAAEKVNVAALEAIEMTEKANEAAAVEAGETTERVNEALMEAVEANEAAVEAGETTERVNEAAVNVGEGMKAAEGVCKLEECAEAKDGSLGVIHVEHPQTETDVKLAEGEVAVEEEKELVIQQEKMTCEKGVGTAKKEETAVDEGNPKLYKDKNAGCGAKASDGEVAGEMDRESKTLDKAEMDRIMQIDYIEKYASNHRRFLNLNLSTPTTPAAPDKED